MSIEFISVIIGLLVFLFAMFIRTLFEAEKIDLSGRIQSRGSGAQNKYQPSVSRFGKFYSRFIERSFGMWFERISLVMGLDMDFLQSRIEIAGKKDSISAIEIVVLKVLGIALLIFVGVPTFFSGDIFWIMLVSICFASMYLLPESKIKGAIKAREELFLSELPTFIEQVYLCIEAGSNLKNALEVVSQRMGGEIGKAFHKAMVMEAYSGSWEHELLSMCEQMHIEALEEFVTDILNANEKGISIVDTLRNEVKHINVINRSRIRELTKKLEASMTIPIMCYFALPVMIIVILPVGMQVLEALG